MIEKSEKTFFMRSSAFCYLLARVIYYYQYGVTVKIGSLFHNPVRCYCCYCCLRLLAKSLLSNHIDFAAPWSYSAMSNHVQCTSYQLVDFFLKNVDSARSFVWNAIALFSCGPFGYFSETHFLDFLILTFYVFTDIIYAFVWTNSASVKLDVNNNDKNDNINKCPFESKGGAEKCSTVNIYVNNQRQDLTYSEFIERIKLIYKRQRVRIFYFQ